MAYIVTYYHKVTLLFIILFCHQRLKPSTTYNYFTSNCTNAALSSKVTELMSILSNTLRASSIS